MTRTDHEDFGGLTRDLLATGAAIRRRDVLRLAVGAGVIHLLGCASPSGPDDGEPNPNCARIPEETAGPFPGDGSNGPNVLGLNGVVRKDIRSSFGGLAGDASGIPLTVAVTLVSRATCDPRAGAAVYLWHCDRAGLYSLYSAGATNQNYLRGVQAADANGRVSFTTVFPGCYAGRWPHIHFEVYPSLAAATSVSNKIGTSQLALPKASCDSVYATTGYQASVANLAGVTLATDNVFGDGSALQVATITGDVSTGLTAALTVAI
jgi:protocatechuate 3,4-dioxygenase beta subunit